MGRVLREGLPALTWEASGQVTGKRGFTSQGKAGKEQQGQRPAMEKLRHLLGNARGLSRAACRWYLGAGGEGPAVLQADG